MNFYMFVAFLLVLNCNFWSSFGDPSNKKFLMILEKTAMFIKNFLVEFDNTHTEIFLHSRVLK